ncbi:hypothetical protein PGT21_009711 [Puccinia graminis f. sp. tritici]|uniref:Uncharacterized protein n=1 Tax=Puccinia graminis f. sp. tritici TaxID=56615 RepID=A0A5B0MR19_PUCGR|nr:hypothetical protein PGT21_009711 [Puccinia graminis f. sp. tritici]
MHSYSSLEDICYPLAINGTATGVLLRYPDPLYAVPRANSEYSEACLPPVAFDVAQKISKGRQDLAVQLLQFNIKTKQSPVKFQAVPVPFRRLRVADGRLPLHADGAILQSGSHDWWAESEEKTENSHSSPISAALGRFGRSTPHSNSTSPRRTQKRETTTTTTTT